MEVLFYVGIALMLLGTHATAYIWGRADECLRRLARSLKEKP